MHIIGASGHGKVIVDISFATKVKIEGVWDDNGSILSLNGVPVDGNLETFKRKNSQSYIIAIGNNSIRKKISTQLKPTNVTAIHPTSSISSSAKIGGGTVIMPNASINACCQIGQHVIINTNASIDHDCTIGDFVHISPQVGIAGNVEIGEGTHVGIGACVIQGISVGKWVTIGAGTVIIRDVPDYAVIVGNPGKIIKYNKNEQ